MGRIVSVVATAVEGFGVLAAAALLWAATLICAAPVAAQLFEQQINELVDRPISEINIVGLEAVDETLVRNNIRAAVGDPLDVDVIAGDVQRLVQLGRFRQVEPRVELRPDGSVAVTYIVEERPIIREVQVVGNTLVSDQELLEAVRLVRLGPRDDFLIGSALRAIEAIYEERGHYLANVTIDEEELEDSGILIFRIIEGPRVKVRAIEFQGNDAFRHERLLKEIQTRTALLFIRRGELMEETLREDVAALDRFYRSRGYMSVRVDRRIELSPDNAEAKVVFLIDEGPQFRVRSIAAMNTLGEPLTVFAPEQIAALAEIRPGDVYSSDLRRKSQTVINDAYNRLGYYSAASERPEQRVQLLELRAGEGPEVDLRFVIDEGEQYDVGLVRVQGNFLTKDKVIRREVLLEPGRPLDASDIEETIERLERTRLFGDIRVTVQEPAEVDPDVRDVLVEVKERNTGSLGFGVAVGSDSGAFGELSLTQRNFDLADTPESWGEFFRGRAFRGAGQSFNMTVRPGNELFLYQVSLTEPHLLDTDYSLSVSGTYFERLRRDYDERRLSAAVALGRELGEVWDLGVRARVESVELQDIEDDAPTEIFLDAGPDTLTGLRLSLSRNTIDDLLNPTAGSYFDIGFERVGLFGGDYDFNRVSTEYTTYLLVSEDFLGRPSTLRLHGELGYVFGGGRIPTYEQFYLGGRSFRGFGFREVSPKGIRADTGGVSDEPVGGEWLVFLGAQYEFPLVGENIRGVVFTDTGTVTDDVGFEDYRISVGGGVRLRIPQLGPAPIALDLAIPVVSEEEDDEQVFSFSIELPL